MKVRISYTVDLEDIPERASKLLDEASSILWDISHHKPSPITRLNVLEKLEEVDSIRKNLLTIDNKLADCYTMLVGYNNVVAQTISNSQEGGESADEHVES